MDRAVRQLPVRPAQMGVGLLRQRCPCKVLLLRDGHITAWLAINVQEDGRVELTVRIFGECLDADRLLRGLLWWEYFIWKSGSELRWL